MAKIPKALHEHINTAFPAHVCLVGTVLPSGFAQVSPRGSTRVRSTQPEVTSSSAAPSSPEITHMPPIIPRR